MGRRTKANRPRNELQVDILNRLTIKPSLKAAAREVGVNPATVFKWIKDSVEDPTITLSWLGYTQTFAAHVQLARRLQIVVLEHEARSLATLGHVQARWHDGRPCYRHDPKVEADALSMDDNDWMFEYGTRSRDDVFARNEAGELIPEEVVSPPNAQLLVKMLSSLVPGYADKSEVSVTHMGHVWLEGSADAPKALPAPSAEFNDGFGLTTRPDQRQRPVNTLAVPRPCVSSEEFDGLYRGKRLLREVVLFRNSAGKLLDLLPDDVLVVGSPQHRAYQDERPDYKPTAVHPTELLNEGYENDWLKALAPNHKPEFKPPTAQENLEVAIKAAAKMAAFEPKPYVSMEARAEGIGRGVPPPGGRRVQL
jgi:hypothetical protein